MLSKRVDELDEERKRLERALAELGGKARRGRPPGRPGGTKSTAYSTAQAPRKRRKRRAGTRADHALGVIEEKPGLGVADIAKALKVKPNYLYRVLGDLEKGGRRNSVLLGAA